MIHFNFPGVRSERMTLIEDWIENCSCSFLVGLNIEVLIGRQNQRISGGRIESGLDFTLNLSISR